ncbi:MAG: hypothetical protein NVS4B11_14200 [Ktedonobacteraceae bacterium]
MRRIQIVKSHKIQKERRIHLMAEAVGLESESVETPETEKDGSGGPDTQQDGNFEGNN